jgi:hypothetical protein
VGFRENFVAFAVRGQEINTINTVNTIAKCHETNAKSTKYNHGYSIPAGLTAWHW